MWGLTVMFISQIIMLVIIFVSLLPSLKEYHLIFLTKIFYICFLVGMAGVIVGIFELIIALFRLIF